jgi:hypothetical protein
LFFTHSQNINFSVGEPYAFDMVLASTKYGDFEKYIKNNIDVSAYDGYFAVICADKTGTGFALPYTEGGSKVLSTERSCFSRTSTRDFFKKPTAFFGAEAQTDAYLRS